MPDTIDFVPQSEDIQFLADEDVAKIGIEEPARAINQSLRTMQLGALAAPEPRPPTPPLNRVVGKYGLEPSPGTQTLIGPQLTKLAQAIPPGQGPVTRPLSSFGRTALGFGAAALEPQNLLATSFAISPPGALAVGGYFGYQGVKGALDSVRNIIKLMQAPGPVDEAFKQKLSDELVNALSMAVAAGEISAAEARGIRQMVITPPVQGPLATGAILPPRRGALPMAGPERLGPPVPPARVRTLQEAEANLPGGAAPLVTAAEAGRDESVIEEIRRRNLNTNEKILNAFPELRTRPSPNQQAARLRRAAAERQGPPLPPGAAPQAPRPLGVRTGDLQGPDQVVAGTRPVVQPMRVENQPVFQGPQIPEVVQAQREREAGMQRELEARRSALQQNIVFWERELEMARNRGDRRAQDNAAKQLLLFRGEYEGIPPVKEIVPKPPIPRAPGSAFRPEVPGTPGQEQESVLAEIRRKNLRTRQQVINNFPGFREGGRSGERAAELLRQAWPQIQGPPLPPEEPPAEPPGPTVPKPPGAPPTAPVAAMPEPKAHSPYNHPVWGEIWIDKVTPTHISFSGLPQETATGTRISKIKVSRREFEEGRELPPEERGAAPQTPPEAPALAPEPVPAVPPPEAAPSPMPATPTPAPEAPVTPEEIATEPAAPTAPATIEDTALAGKTLGEWEAIKDASQLPRGTARAELAKWLAVPNQPSRILQALGNKRRTREIHAPPMEVTPIQPAPAPETTSAEPPAAAAPEAPPTPPSAPAAPTEPPTTSVEGAPSQTPSTETPVQQKKPFDTKRAKQQKTFLLTEVDKAIAEAPDVKEKWQNSGLATDYNLATGTATPEQLEALFAKYDIPTEIAPSTPYTDIEGKPAQVEKGHILTPAARIERLKLAIEKVNFDSAPKVTIDVPGDGTFSIVDSKSALEAFKERAKKFPTAAPKTSTPSKGRITPTAVAALGTLNADSAKRAASLFASTDLGRNVINYAYSDGRTTVATDGRRLIVVNAPIGGTPKKPALVRLNDKAKPLGKDDKFPNYNQVIPSDASQTTIFQGLDASRLFNIVQQAKQALGDKINSVTLYRNTDGSLGMTSGEPAIGEYSHNIKPDAKIVTTLNADYLADIFSAARIVGDEKVNLSAEFSGLRGEEGPQTPELNPIVVKGKNFKAVLMPMRDASGKLPPGASQLNRGDISKPSMGPGAAAVAEFDEVPPDLEVTGLKTGSPFINEMNRRWRNLFAGFGQLTGRGKTKKDIALSINAMETIPNMVAQQAGNSFRLMLDDVRQQRAVTALMQSLKMSGEGLSQEDAARLGELQFAGDPQGYLRAKQTDMETLAQSQLSNGKRLEAQAAKEWAIALSDARTQFNQLRPVAQEAKRRLDRQLRREAAAGIETNYELWYVPQRYDFDLLPSANRPIVIGGQRGGSPSTSFRKAKYFEDYASAMEAGHIPRTFSIADLIEHRVRQGERLVARKAMFQGLKGMTDDLTGDPIAMNIPKRVIERPDGSVDVQESIPRDYEPVDVIPGVRLAIHKGYARGIRAMTGTSQISESAIVSSLQNLAAVEKHLGLALDTFHLSRTLQTEFALTHRMSLPFTERTRRGAALVEYSTADLDRAVQKGEITQGIADWITKPQSFNVQGRDIQMSPKAVVNLGARSGLGIGRIADVIYKDWIRQTPVFGTINKIVFDKITRSAVAQGFISEFDRVSRQHPEWAGEKVAKSVASDINVLFGNLQKESWVKSPSLNALMQIAFLAPNWVQSLIRREARAVIQVGQAAVGVAKGEGFRIGSAGKAMGEGILMYLVGTQLLNLITRGHLTFQNEEEGHKLDAFIPDPFTPGKGFFISPLSVFGEITHDLIRYAQSKPDLATAITQIGANKFGNVGRAIAVTATGRDPIDNHKLIGTANRAMAAAYQLIPVPITLSGVGKEALGKSFPDLVTRPTTTQVGRQVASSLGFKVEPAPTAQAQISALVDRWKAGQEPAVASQVTRRLQEDFGPSNYRELRSALVNEQTDQATRAYRALRQEGKTPEQIRKIIEHPHPFAGSRALEARFVDSLSPQEQKLYERALDEREEIISRFEQMLDNRPQLTEEESQ